MLALVMAAAIAPVYRDGPFTCTVPIIDPAGTNMWSSSAHSSNKWVAGPKNGAANVDLGGHFVSDFGTEATFTLPEVPTNRGVFYSNWILLIPYKSHAFVQIELMRWKKYQYRQEIGLTWGSVDGALFYRDTEVWLAPGPHRLRISEAGGSIAFAVDGKPICHAPAGAFFTTKDVLYYQLGTEVERYGDRPAGTLSDIRVKDDNDVSYRRADPHCVYRGYGLSWEYSGNGRYEAAGVFDPTQPYLKFTGNSWSEPCKM